jgi:D-alanyl-D-alanine dipeptidase
MTTQTAAIPLHAGETDDWRNVPIEPCDEPLIAIGRGSVYDDLVTSAVYAGEHLHSPYRDDNVIDAAHPVVYVRESVAERLRYAQSLLLEGLRLIVFDGYRSIAVQQALYDQFLSELRFLRPEWDETQLREETERYVSLPSTESSRPSPHSTGGAVDVAIILDNCMIEFGTPFDHGSERSALSYFEHDGHITSQADEHARDNRRLLYNIMHEAGFEGFEHEWWHYNAPETQMGVRAAGSGVAAFADATTLLPRQASGSVHAVLSSHEEPHAPIDRIAPMN